MRRRQGAHLRAPIRSHPLDKRLRRSLPCRGLLPVPCERRTGGRRCAGGSCRPTRPGTLTGGASTRPSSPPMTTKVWDVVSVEVGGNVAVGLVVGDVAACGGESVAAGCSSPPPHATGNNGSDM